MKSREFAKLIEKHLNEECSPEEEYLIEEYLNFLQLKNGYSADADKGDASDRENKIYLEIIKKMKREERDIIKKTVYSAVLLKIAASIAALLVIAYAVYNFTGSFKPQPELIAWKERVTVPGERAIITLGDNSKVTLNGDSRLKYPSRMNGKTREVYLEGEAFFEVQHDSSKPFLVHSGDITTTVLGTKFNVDAYNADKEISVSLVEGEVKISDNKETGAEDLIILKPEQQLVFDKNEEISRVEIFDQQKEIGWKDNILKFNNEPIEKVFKSLERTFGVKFELVLKEQEKPKITANFKNNSFTTIVEVIKKLTGLQCKYERENNEIKKVKFFKK